MKTGSKKPDAQISIKMWYEPGDDVKIVHEIYASPDELIEMLTAAFEESPELIKTTLQAILQYRYNESLNKDITKPDFKE